MSISRTFLRCFGSILATAACVAPATAQGVHRQPANPPGQRPHLPTHNPPHVNVPQQFNRPVFTPQFSPPYRVFNNAPLNPIPRVQPFSPANQLINNAPLNPIPQFQAAISSRYIPTLYNPMNPLSPYSPFYALGSSYGYSPFQSLNPYNSFGQNTYNPFGQNAYNPFAQNVYNPFAQNAYNPFGQSAYNPYGMVNSFNPYGIGNSFNPYAISMYGVNSYSPYASNPFALGAAQTGLVGSWQQQAFGFGANASPGIFGANPFFRY